MLNSTPEKLKHIQVVLSFKARMRLFTFCFVRKSLAAFTHGGKIAPSLFFKGFLKTKNN